LGSIGALNGAAFAAGAGLTAAADADDRLVFNTSTGNLYYDPDGVGGSASMWVAWLVSVNTLSASDVEVVA